jgi:choline kinase
MENRFKNNDNVLLITNKDLVFEKTFVDEIIEKVGQQFVINISLEELDKCKIFFE